MGDRRPRDENGYPVEWRKVVRGYRPNPPRPMDEKRKARFIEHLSKHGVVGEAAKAASMHSHVGCLQSFYNERRKDPSFAEAWDNALEMAREACEYELHRRAVMGVDEPVYYKGAKVGSIRKYSDQLLLARMRKLDPGYREQSKVDHTGLVEVKPLGLDQLSPQEREMLRQLLTMRLATSEARVVPAITVEDTPVTDDQPEHEP